MKRFLMIVLLVCFVASTGIVALADVRFGAWSYWDKFFLPVRFWESQIANKGYAFFREIRFDQSICITHLGFYDSSNSKRMNVFLFSPMPPKDKLEELDKIFYAFDYHLALAVFPSSKGKVRVIAYKKADGGLQFFEQWKIPFKEKEVVPKDAKFRQVFKEWMEKQVVSEKTISEDIINFMLLEGFAITGVITGAGAYTK